MFEVEVIPGAENQADVEAWRSLRDRLVAVDMDCLLREKSIDGADGGKFGLTAAVVVLIVSRITRPDFIREIAHFVNRDRGGVKIRSKGREISLENMSEAAVEKVLGRFLLAEGVDIEKTDGTAPDALTP